MAERAERRDMSQHKTAMGNRESHTFRMKNNHKFQEREERKEMSSGLKSKTEQVLARDKAICKV